MQHKEPSPALKAALKPLHDKLQKAVELELSTIPPYLTAMFSLFPRKNREAASIIRSVFMEEMLHMLLAANVFNAVGGTVKLGEAQVPGYPLRLEFEGQNFKDREFDVNLDAMTKDNLEIFMQIELPDNWNEPQPKQLLTAEVEIPGYTIGEFYESIKQDLLKLCTDFGEEQVFCGNQSFQIGEDFYWSGGGKPIVVTDLTSANHAIDLIVEQGEGANGGLFDGDTQFGQPAEVAHFFRFSELYYGRSYLPSDNPKLPPTGPELAVNFEEVYKLKPNCKQSDFAGSSLLAELNHDFNSRFSLMLQQLEEGFGGHPKVLYTAIMNGMHGLLEPAFKMVQLPLPNDPKGRHGAPSFEWVAPQKFS